MQVPAAPMRKVLITPYDHHFEDVSFLVAIMFVLLVIILCVEFFSGDGCIRKRNDVIKCHYICVCVCVCGP